MRNQKGITLIALVITIIVLLILAGVSIAMLTGENGLLNRASGAGVTSEVGTAKEQVSLAINDLVAEYYEKKYNPATDEDKTATSGKDVGVYVAENLKTQLAKAEYSDYAEAAEYSTTAKTTTVTLKKQDKDGNTLTADYDADTAKLGTYETATSGS